MTEGCSIRPDERGRAEREPAREAARDIERDAEVLERRAERLILRIQHVLMKLECDIAEAQACLSDAARLVADVEKLVQAAGPSEAERLRELVSAIALLKNSLAELCNVARKPRVLGE